MRKKWTAAAVTTVFTLGLLPYGAFAATDVSITDAEAGDNQITISYRDGEAGDWYNLYWKDDLILHGTLTETDADRGKKTLYYADGRWKTDDKLRIEMREDSKGNYVYDTLRVGDEYSEIDKDDVGLSLSAKRISFKDGAQTVIASFSSNYSPDNDDVILITPLDENGRATGIASQVEIKRNGLRADDTRLHLNPTSDIYEYRVEVVRDGRALAKTTIEVTGQTASNKNPLEDATLNVERSKGKVNTEEDVTFTLTDKDGKRISADIDKVKVTVDNLSAPGAVVLGSVKDPSTLENGKGTLRLISNLDTKADITLSFMQDNKILFTAKPFTFTFGNATDKPIVNNPTIVMTIGNNEFFVDDKSFTSDVAPYIDNSRTFVPLRALMEGFGANVYFNNSNKTITITADDDIILMTLNNQAYTVNGANKTMDVAPYVANGNRTVVPVRFVAEALGYQVDFGTDSHGKHIIYKKA